MRVCIVFVVCCGCLWLFCVCCGCYVIKVCVHVLNMHMRVYHTSVQKCCVCTCGSTCTYIVFVFVCELLCFYVSTVFGCEFLCLRAYI